MKALGMIEVYGYLAAVEALDSAVKQADVRLLEVTKVRGGLVTVMVTGEVAAAKAAMDAAETAAAKVGEVISVHVIARPGFEITVSERDEQEQYRENGDEPNKLTRKSMEQMTVEQLRSAARELELKNMTKHEIRFAKKEELIKKLLEEKKKR